MIYGAAPKAAIRKAVFDALRRNGVAMNGAEASSLTEQPSAEASEALKWLYERGRVDRVSRGRYVVKRAQPRLINEGDDDA